MGGELIGWTLDLAIRGELHPIPQNSRCATFAPFLKKEDGLINWSYSAKEIYNRIRGLNPWPGTYTSAEKAMLRIWRASLRESFCSNYPPGTLIHTLAEGPWVQCGSGGIKLEEVQPENRKRISGQDFMNGLRLPAEHIIKLGG
jgi:methionyl-tRNA formyltransferase